MLGGYELLCANVVEQLKRLGHEVFVLTSTHGVFAPQPENGILRGLRLYAPFSRAAKMERGARKTTYRHNRAVATKHLKEFCPDIVFVWSQLRLTTGAAIAAQDLGIPVAFTMNDDHLKSHAPTPPTSLRKAVRCLLDATWDRTITLRDLDLTHTACISDQLKQSLLAQDIPIPNAEVIYQGIPLEDFPLKKTELGALHQPIRLCYAGQLHEYKGVHLALSALDQLQQKHPGKYQLKIVGTGPEAYLHRLHKQVQSQGLSSQVEFEGHVNRSRISQYYQESDLLLVTSLWEEPFGLTHLEAMASGTPVISTFRGGMKEFLIDGENCLIFDPDRPDHLASQIETLVDHEPLRTQIIQKALTLVTHTYSIKRYTRDLINFLNRTIQTCSDAKNKNKLHTVHVPRRFVLDAWGGTETVVLETCRRLPALGVESKIFCPAALSTPGPDSINDVSIQRFPYFYPYLGLSSASASALDLKGGNLFSVSLYRKLLKEPDLDLIHLHTAKRLGGIGRLAAQKRNIPYVISIHGGMIDVPADEAATWTAPTAGTLEWGKLLGMMVGSRRVLDDAGAIICVDCSESERMKKRYPNKRVEFVPNGVDPAPYEKGDGSRFRKEQGIAADQKIILNISRIDPQKNQLLAVEVLDRTRRAGENAKLVLIGPVTNVEYHAALEAAIKEKGLSEHVLLIPGLPPGSQMLYDAYTSADLFLLSSNHEPFGIVILEAWAAGAPVVAASVGGVPDFTHHEEDILRFERGNAAEATEHTLRILQNPDLAQSLRDAARKLVQVRYHWDTITQQLIDLYKEVIEEHRLNNN